MRLDWPWLQMVAGQCNLWPENQYNPTLKLPDKLITNLNFVCLYACKCVHVHVYVRVERGVFSVYLKHTFLSNDVSSLCSLLCVKWRITNIFPIHVIT